MKSIDPKDKMIFALEQPEEPKYKPEVVSFWWTREWKSLKLQMDWNEQAFNQGDLVYKPEATPVKPTKFGGNLVLELPKEKNDLAVSRPSEGSGDSKRLARWVPRLMDLVADALCRQAFKETAIKCKAMTWAEHCAAGHVPFRTDCRVCQESSAKGRPHRKVAYPLNGTLSLDVAGPLKKAKEMFWAEGGGYMRYILVGAFTWLKPKGGESDPPEVHEDDHGEDLPELADDEAEEDPVPGEGDGGERLDEETPEGDEPQEEVTEERQEPELNIFRFCIPLQGKTKDVVLKAINELYIQLRVHGYTVTRLHSDRGGEFRGKGLEQWCRTRDIHRTKTAGMSPQSNGRVERSVQEIKARI